MEAVFVVADGSVEAADCGADFLERDGVGVAFFVVGHVDERVECYRAGEGDAWFDSPVPFVRLHGGMVIELPVQLLVEASCS